MEKVDFNTALVNQQLPVDDRMERMADTSFAAFEANSLQFGNRLENLTRTLEKKPFNEIDPQKSDMEVFLKRIEEVTERSIDIMTTAIDARIALAKFSVTSGTAKNFGQHFNSFLRGS